METPKTPQERWAFIVKLAIEKSGASSASAFARECVDKAPSTMSRWVMSGKEPGVDPKTIDWGDISPVLEYANITPNQFENYIENGSFADPKPKP